MLMGMYTTREAAEQRLAHMKHHVARHCHIVEFNQMFAIKFGGAK